MKPIKKGLTARAAIRLLFYTLVFDTIIALFLTAIQFGGGFWINFFFSQSIGLSCCTCVMAALHFFPGDKPLLKAVRVAVALVIGSLGGSFLGATASGIGAAALFEKHGLFQLLTLGVMFGSIITYFFSSREQIATSREQLQEEKIKRLTSEKKAVEASAAAVRSVEPVAAKASGSAAATTGGAAAESSAAATSSVPASSAAAASSAEAGVTGGSRLESMEQAFMDKDACAAAAPV